MKQRFAFCTVGEGDLNARSSFHMGRKAGTATADDAGSLYFFMEGHRTGPLHIPS